MAKKQIANKPSKLPSNPSKTSESEIARKNYERRQMEKLTKENEQLKQRMQSLEEEIINIKQSSMSYKLIGIKNKATGKMNEYRASFGDKKQKATDFIKENFKKGREKGKKLKDFAIGKAKGLKNSAFDKAKGLKNSAFDKAKGLKNSAFDKAKGLKNSAFNKAGEIKDSAFETTVEIGNLAEKEVLYVKGKMAEKVNSVKNAATDKIITGAKKVGSAIYKVGDNMERNTLEKRFKDIPYEQITKMAKYSDSASRAFALYKTEEGQIGQDGKQRDNEYFLVAEDINKKTGYRSLHGNLDNLFNGKDKNESKATLEKLTKYLSQPHVQLALRETDGRVGEMNINEQGKFVSNNKDFQKAVDSGYQSRTRAIIGKPSIERQAKEKLSEVGGISK